MITELIVGACGLAMVVSNARLIRFRPFDMLPVVGAVMGGILIGAALFGVPSR